MLCSPASMETVDKMEEELSHDDQSKKLKRGRSTEPRRWPVVNIDHINVYNIQFKLHESRMTEITEELQEISAKVEDKPRRDDVERKEKDGT
ncbi:hypothetical protein INR49_019777 [Caranx melampygus]|nr:hypothetical protein INR49_019777 [Caranx melampygus]